MDIQPVQIAIVGLSGSVLAGLVTIVWRLSKTVNQLEVLEKKVVELEKESDDRNREEWSRWVQFNLILGRIDGAQTSTQAQVLPNPTRRSRP